MARYTDSVCKLCRREGMQLFLKGDRCLSDKCAVKKRSYAPGQHGQRRPKHSEYGIQLREKQKAKRIYGLLERQFKNCFEKAERQKGVTGENLLRLLDMRLDNVVYRLGFATSLKQGRQLVMHGHFNLNGKKVNIPSYTVKKGDAVEVREGSKRLGAIQSALERVERRGIPKWLSLDKGSLRGVVLDYPQREDLGEIINENLIVELYSK